jgi:hypothetical protein
MFGIIYKISSSKGKNVYYGSTTQTLESRFSKHRSEYKLSRGYCSSSVLFEEYGIDNCIVEKVEEVSIDSLRERERYWIDNDENCVNKKRPWVSEDERKEEMKEYSREWYEEHKEEMKEYHKEYYEEHKEEMKEYHKEWREQNKEYAKDWYERNKENVKEYNEKNKEKMKEYQRLYRLKRKLL